MSDKIIQLNEDLIKHDLKDLVRRVVSSSKSLTFDKCQTLMWLDTKLPHSFASWMNILRWQSHPIFWNRAMESVIESQSSDGGSHDLCRGSQ